LIFRFQFGLQVQKASPVFLKEGSSEKSFFLSLSRRNF
jgi:hypothetical protein